MCIQQYQKIPKYWLISSNWISIQLNTNVDSLLRAKQRILNSAQEYSGIPNIFGSMVIGGASTFRGTKLWTPELGGNIREASMSCCWCFRGTGWLLYEIECRTKWTNGLSQKSFLIIELWWTLWHFVYLTYSNFSSGCIAETNTPCDDCYSLYWVILLWSELKIWCHILSLEKHCFLACQKLLCWSNANFSCMHSFKKHLLDSQVKLDVYSKVGKVGIMFSFSLFSLFSSCLTFSMF